MTKWKVIDGGLGTLQTGLFEGRIGADIGGKNGIQGKEEIPPAPYI